MCDDWYMAKLKNPWQAILEVYDQAPERSGLSVRDGHLHVDALNVIYNETLALFAVRETDTEPYAEVQRALETFYALQRRHGRAPAIRELLVFIRNAWGNVVECEVRVLEPEGA